MQYVKIIETSNEPEALMYKELLINNGIPAKHALPNSLETIRLNWGGANFPSEVWGVFVPDTDVAKAQELLPEPVAHIEKPSAPQKVFKGMIVVYLISLVIAIVIAISVAVNFIL